MMMFPPFVLKLSESCFGSVPPVRRMDLSGVCLTKSDTIENVCMASSRVGETMRAPTVWMFLGGLRRSISMIGTTKARVLPDPVT
jgi:hypothetical protein